MAAHPRGDIRDRRGLALLRHRAERVERSFAHLYETCAVRRTHLRGHQNILKRLLVHAGGFNLGLVMRQLVGAGTPRGLQARLGPLVALLAMPKDALAARWPTLTITTHTPVADLIHLRSSLAEAARA